MIGAIARFVGILAARNTASFIQGFGQGAKHVVVKNIKSFGSSVKNRVGPMLSLYGSKVKAQMRANRLGSIINLLSLGGMVYTVYDLTKWDEVSFTEKAGLLNSARIFARSAPMSDITGAVIQTGSFNSTTAINNASANLVTQLASSNMLAGFFQELGDVSDFRKLVCAAIFFPRQFLEAVNEIADNVHGDEEILLNYLLSTLALSGSEVTDDNGALGTSSLQTTSRAESATSLLNFVSEDGTDTDAVQESCALGKGSQTQLKISEVRRLEDLMQIYGKDRHGNFRLAEVVRLLRALSPSDIQACLELREIL